MSGLAKRMPWTMAAFALASLSVVGIPGTSGCISKWYLALGCVDRPSAVLLGVLLVSSLLSAAYLGPIVYKAYFEDGSATHRAKVREVPWMVAPLAISAAASLLLGPLSNARPETGRERRGFSVSDGERHAMNFLERQLEDPVRLGRIKRWFYIGLAAVAVAEIVLPLVWYLLKLVFEA